MVYLSFCKEWKYETSDKLAGVLGVNITGNGASLSQLQRSAFTKTFRNFALACWIREHMNIDENIYNSMKNIIFIELCNFVDYTLGGHLNFANNLTYAKTDDV